MLTREQLTRQISLEFRNKNNGLTPTGRVSKAWKIRARELGVFADQYCGCGATLDYKGFCDWCCHDRDTECKQCNLSLQEGY